MISAGLKKMDRVRGHGHAFYAQNEEGTKTFQSNIAYRGAGWNVHVYTQAGQIVGFDIIDNICYLAGALKEGQTLDNILIGGYSAADRIRIIGNLAYQPIDAERWRSNVYMAQFLKQGINGQCTMRDNYFAGAYVGVTIGEWQDLEFTNNTIWATDNLIEIKSAPRESAIDYLGKAYAPGALPAENGGKSEFPKVNLKGFKVSGNTYFDNRRKRIFHYGTTEVPVPENLYKFEDWQKLGLDEGSKLIKGWGCKPDGHKVFVFPNKYEQGRANVGIFNWDGEDTVKVNLGNILEIGQKYVVYNCLDLRQLISKATPVLKKTYDGKPMAFPMRKDKTSPDFDAFLVLNMK